MTKHFAHTLLPFFVKKKLCSISYSRMFFIFRTMAIYLYWSGCWFLLFLSSHNFQVVRKMHMYIHFHTHIHICTGKWIKCQTKENSPNGHVVQYLPFAIEHSTLSHSQMHFGKTNKRPSWLPFSSDIFVYNLWLCL